jgi:hypothetical protein
MKLKYLFLYGLALTVISCSLDHDPIDTFSEITEGTNEQGEKVFFKDKAAVESHRQALYDQIRNSQEHWYLDLLLLAEVHSDNAYAGTPGAETTPFEENSIEGSNMNLARDWPRYLTTVGLTNQLIVYIDSVADNTLTQAERKQYKAEAKILRAMVYFDMVRIWGNIPIITTIAGDITSETIEDVYPAYFPPQNTEIEVYEQIEKDLLEALPDAPDNNPENKTLLTKSVARTILAKMYAEKPLRDYAKVIQYCDELTADGFDLVADFSDLFGVTLKDNSLPVGPDNMAVDAKTRNTVESILEAQYLPGNGNWAAMMFGRILNDWDGSFTWAKWITPSRDLIKAFTTEGDTKRLEESVVYYDCGWIHYYPADHYAFMYKYRSNFNNMIKYRYADVLLLKAEALIMSNGNLSEAAAIINKIRARVNLSSLPTSVVGSKDALLEALLKERRLELAFEGQRWFDLVRLDKVEPVMNSVNATDQGRWPQIYPFNQHSYKLPIPQQILDQNPNLVQNPGY